MMKASLLFRVSRAELRQRKKGGVTKKWGRRREAGPGGFVAHVRKPDTIRIRRSDREDRDVRFKSQRNVPTWSVVLVKMGV